MLRILLFACICIWFAVTILAVDVVEGNEAAAPEQLLGGGEHFDDDPARLFRRARRYRPEQLPREKMLRHVINNNLVRPARSRSRV